MHALGYNSTHIITLEHIHVPSSFIYCLASITILCQSRHLLKYSSVEKALTDRGLRRSLIASIFLHRGQLPSPRGKLRRTRTKSNLEEQKLKHIALYMALAIKGFSKERNATTH
ncbi:hypothetical protein SLEP1_g47890 [Rubroshorea leprosula]|uniref:Uncharacterized protein n=1 Tax=Rubroshorea leprosula TaxID=152421 RepID=A0AAV5LRZ7_9ROSI|nr:hypothetical protein SLEP1_g47890 [Rubroshorea leprosula]